ncbi:MAG TPA: cytochrome c oxidase accessory protein CcoG [Candidatus Dormibacteraeota bacterium]|nr:cytochrome c oxidase accessory protein CcoG [Candidatus Dormibacteraeota bacterium]
MTPATAQRATDTAPPRPASPIHEVPLYAKRQHIYQKEIQGPWQRLRAVTLFVLAGIFLAAPWLTWDGRQAIWFDLPNRKFYLFALTFWPQDFIFLSWMLMIAAFSLFFFTALAGRLWCGYACPQTVWTKFFMWIEWLVEGDRNDRIRLDRSRWSADKLARKAGKHAAWLLLAAVVALTFIGYFTPVRALLPRVAGGGLGGWETFFACFFTAALYLDAGWMREQICKYACPYARFQGAMFDTDTLTIFYDTGRGEPRGHRGRATDPRAARLGDCIDCGLCVHVCPTGIDIRQGTQYDCIGCAACIDACDSVMDEMGYAKGLVRYASETSLRTGHLRLLRPRVIGYGVILSLIAGTFAYALTQRVPLRVDVLHDRARLYRLTNDGLIENTYTLKIMNLDQRPHAYVVTASGLEHLTLVAPDDVRVAPGEIADVPVRLQAPPDELDEQAQEVRFAVSATDVPGVAVRETSRFLAPAPHHDEHGEHERD